MRFLLLSGSFHSNSASIAILNAISALLQEHQCVLAQLEQLPFYSNDLNNDKPQVIVDFIEQVNTADGIIICSPEYNHSIPAVIKNAIDWASRPAFNSALKDKAISIITQADSPVGGARAQAHFKLIFDSTLSRIQPCHEMMICDVKAKINAQQIFDDEASLVRLRRHLDHFITFI